MSWFKDLLTDVDNQTYDLIRVLAVVSVVIGLSLQVWVVIRWHAPQAFDFQQFGIGLAAMFGGVGVALKLQPPMPEKE